VSSYSDPLNKISLLSWNFFS